MCNQYIQLAAEEKKMDGQFARFRKLFEEDLPKMECMSWLFIKENDGINLNNVIFIYYFIKLKKIVYHTLSIHNWVSY